MQEFIDDTNQDNVDGGVYIASNSGNDDVTGMVGIPTQSTDMQNSNDSAYGGFLNKLGSIGTIATQAGTVIGTAQRQISQAQGNYNAAKANASSGNSIGTFWLYASSTDKIMIVLAATAILITLGK